MAGARDHKGSGVWGEVLTVLYPGANCCYWNTINIFQVVPHVTLSHSVQTTRGTLRGGEKKERLLKGNTGVEHYNLGTGRGYSVLELVEAFSKACNKKIDYVITGRRPGDAAACYADRKSVV